MEPTIFYSWQSDSPGHCNRNFIRKALDEAVALILPTGTVNDSPRVDSGMERIAGSPEVASVMFDKIKKSAFL